jgi:two-component system, chemotaxis family, chemotaxis protein CheY
MDTLNFMIVDDSRVTIEIVKRTVEQLGHKVVKTATSGPEAIEAYGICRPDVVTMDLTMPGMDGLVATNKILEKHPNARIIMVTSRAEQSVVIEALKSGAKSYLVKPFKVGRLEAAIAEVMKAKPASQWV